jgi:hypothetical protein
MWAEVRLSTEDMRHCGTSLTECRNGTLVQPMNVSRAATVSSLVIAFGLIGCLLDRLLAKRTDVVTTAQVVQWTQAQ